MAEPNLSGQLVRSNQRGRGACTRCGGKAIATSATVLCVACRRICPTCGGPKKKDTTLECDPCSRKRRYQEHPEHLASAVEASAAKKRGTGRRFGDITEADFTNSLRSGRWYTRYTDDGGRTRMIYRYQWRWIKANGPIPAGCQVHHKNTDHTDDDLGNLELLTESDHHKLHAAKVKKERWPCQRCGTLFRKFRSPGRPSKFCSRACFLSA